MLNIERPEVEKDEYKEEGIDINEGINECYIDDEEYCDIEEFNTNNNQKVGFTPEEAKKVAEENTKLIHSVAKNYRHGTIPYDDIVGAGTYGYAKAISAFDKSLGYEFSTFAIHCIRNEIITFLKKEKKHLEGDISMSTPLGHNNEDGTLTLADTLSTTKDSGLDVEANMIFEEDVKVLMKAVSMLHPRERFVIENRFELNGKKQMTQEEVGKVLNRTQAGISKLERSIIEKLKMILKGQVETENGIYQSNTTNYINA